MGNEQGRPELERGMSRNSVMSAGGGIANQLQTAMNRKEMKANSKKLEKAIKEDFKNESKYIKLLVLGAGESGKSTIIKQMKLIHPHVDGRDEEGFTKEERLSARKAIYLNIVDNMLNLIAATESLEIPGWESLCNNNDKSSTLIDEYYNTLSRHVPKAGEDFDPKLSPTPEIISAIKNLWSNETIVKAYKRRNEFQLADSMAYFIEHLDRVGESNYEPTDQDVLRTRVKTTGVSSIEFTFKKVQFRMFDVGGQRSERKKWIHCFDNVTAIMFVVSIAEYDQVLEEDGITNRMIESMELFENIVNNTYFKKKSFIVFFNKKDLFEKKIQEKGIKDTFPDYTGDPRSFTESSEYLVKAYLAKNRGECSDRSMYPHLTTATDTEHVKFVFVTVADIILTQCLGDLLLN